MSKIAALVPIKTNSRRLPNKNFLQLGEIPMCRHIFNTLGEVDGIDVYCYTSNISIMSLLPNYVHYLPRNKMFDGDTVNAQELFLSAIKMLTKYETILITHATSPLIKSESIKKAIDIYKNKNNYFDSVVACRKFKKYSWFNNETLNYNRFVTEQTNDLKPVFIETSGFYIFNRNYYLETKSRIGLKPYFYNVDYDESIDVDNLEDFIEAAKLLSIRNNFKFSDSKIPINLSPEALKIININNSIDLIIFDLDGVLIDSCNLMRKAWNYSCEKFKVNIEFEVFFKSIGMRFDDIMDGLNISKDIQKDFANTYFDCCKNEIDMIKTFADILNNLKILKQDFLLAINTSKPIENTKLIVKKLFANIDFDFICAPELIPSKRGKPAPDSLLFICASLGVDPENAIYVGDMDVDNKCAKRACINYIHAGWGYGNPVETSTIWFENISDLTTYFFSTKNPKK